MVAAPASQHNCAFCEKPSEGFQGTHVCPHCGKPQPLPLSGRAGADYFSALGLQPRFSINREQMEKRFYEVSRTLHPDRFTRADAQSRQLSLERMSLVNDAYRTLKDPVKRRDYFLQLCGFRRDPAAKTTQIPTELAESWFELQDALSESPQLAVQKLAAFTQELTSLKTLRQKSLQTIEAEIDTALERGIALTGLGSLIERLSSEMLAENYLNSMAQDVERIKKRLV